jgi:hypothetical protein
VTDNATSQSQRLLLASSLGWRLSRMVAATEQRLGRQLSTARISCVWPVASAIESYGFPGRTGSRSRPPSSRAQAADRRRLPRQTLGQARTVPDPRWRRDGISSTRSETITIKMAGQPPFRRADHPRRPRVHRRQRASAGYSRRHGTIDSWSARCRLLSMCCGW